MMDWQALGLSLRLAVATAFTLLVVGLPFTFYLSQTDKMWVNFAEAFFSLPMVLPPTVLGFYLLLVLGPLHLAFSFSGLLIASILSSMPFAFQSFLASFRSVDRDYLDRSVSLGEGYWMTLVRVAGPLAKEGIVAGVVLAFAHALGEFGVVLMIGGNIAGVSRTLAISLYDQVEAFDSHAANITAAVLLVLSALAMATVSGLRATARNRWQTR